MSVIMSVHPPCDKFQKVAIFFYEDGSRRREVLTDFLSDAEFKNIFKGCRYCAVSVQNRRIANLRLSNYLRAVIIKEKYDVQ